jgi:hypothetical protein
MYLIALTILFLNVHRLGQLLVHFMYGFPSRKPPLGNPGANTDKCMRPLDGSKELKGLYSQQLLAMIRKETTSIDVSYLIPTNPGLPSSHLRGSVDRGRQEIRH